MPAHAGMRARAAAGGGRPVPGSGSGLGLGPGLGLGLGSLPGLVLFEPGVAGMGYSATRSAPARQRVSARTDPTVRQPLSENRPCG